MNTRYWAVFVVFGACVAVVGCDSGSSRQEMMEPTNMGGVDMASGWNPVTPSNAPDLAGMPNPSNNPNPSMQPQSCTDTMEPNGDRGAAKTVTAGAAQSGLTSCVGDDDWYLVKLAAGDTLEIQVDSATPARITATITEGSQGAVLAKAVAGASGLSTSVQPGAAGDYFVHVTASDQATYDLALVVTPNTKSCAAGTHIQNGKCIKDGCDDLGLEANETVATARTLVPGSYKSLKICDANDRDFYAVSAGTGGGLLTVSVKFKHAMGNLDLYITDGTVTTDGYLKTLDASTGEEDNEYVVNLMLTDATPVYVLVQGDMSAVNGYDLDVTIDPMDATRDCLAGCTMLMQLSASAPVDPSTPEAIAAGYYIGTEPEYSYARRDLAMWMQWAFAQVVKKFPNTHPLYISDFSNSQGLTPGTGTTGGPRHPTTTHVGGHDVDIAYFSTLADNDYRIICGDGSDNNGNGQQGNYNDGYFCTTNQNVVDMPRQAYFMSLMMAFPYFRVVGVDQTLPSQLIAAVDALIASGDLPEWAGHKMRTGLGYGAAGGWQFHHHHIHYSSSDR
jgi:hypothetical protein